MRTVEATTSSRSVPPVATPPRPQPKPPAPDTDTDTETETETDSESERKPPPASRATQQSRQAARPPTSNAQPQEPARPAPAHESRTSTMPPRDPNNSGSGPQLPPADLDSADLESVLEWAVHFAEQRTRGASATGPSAAGPSSSSGRAEALADLRARFRAAARSRTPQQVRRHSGYPPMEQPPITSTNPDVDMLPQSEELLNAFTAAASGTRPVCSYLISLTPF
jgi:hypothetical protein